MGRGIENIFSLFDSLIARLFFLTEACARETMPAKPIEGSVMARATGGRAGRHLRRSQALPINPAPPGGFGGQYKPLSISDMERIYDVALRLLEELGVGEVPGRLRDLFVQQGARFEAGRIHIPRRLIA